MPNVTHFDYDDLGQLRHETITVGAVTYSRAYHYNLVGQPTQYTDRDGRVTLFDYDDLGRKIAERWYDESNTLVNTVTTHYDILGRVHSVGDDFSSFTYAYDLKDRLVSETIDNAGTPTVVLATGYGSNSLGQAAQTDALRTTLSVAIGPQGSATPDFQNLYHYDPLDRMDKVGQTSQTGGNAVASKFVTFSYTDANQLEYVRR